MVFDLNSTLKKIFTILALSSVFSCFSDIGTKDQGAAKPFINQYQPQPYQPQVPARSDSYYYNQQQQQVPQYGNPNYNPYQAGSRYYTNPYAMPPRNQYPYYDGDQYYVPPTFYGAENINSSASQKY